MQKLPRGASFALQDGIEKTSFCETDKWDKVEKRNKIWGHENGAN